MRVIHDRYYACWELETRTRCGEGDGINKPALLISHAKLNPHTMNRSAHAMNAPTFSIAIKRVVFKKINVANYLKIYLNKDPWITVFLLPFVCPDGASHDSSCFGMVLRNSLHNLRTISHL